MINKIKQSLVTTALLLLSSYSFAYDGLVGDEDVTLAESVETRLAPQVRLPVAVTFVASADVHGDRIWLSDLAQCSGAAALCRETSSIDLGPAPQPGRTLRIQRDALESQVLEEWTDAELSFAGPKWVKITASHRTLSEEEVRSALLESLPDGGDRFRFIVNRVQMVGPTLVRDGPGSLRFPDFEHVESLDLFAQRFLSPQTLKATWVPGGGGSSISFNVSVVVIPQVKKWVARAALSAGSVIESKDLIESWMPLRRLDVHAEKSWIVGRVLRYSIQAGFPIPQNATTLPQLVRRGEYMQMNVGRDGFRVTSRVESLGQGQVGDVIDVQIPESRKRMRARIVGKGLVEAL